VVLPAVMCLECRCVYRPVRTPLKVVQEGGCPRCGYVGWTLAPPSSVIDDGAATDPAHALDQRVTGLREAPVQEPPVARTG
jgi:hypothetical protein